MKSQIQIIHFTFHPPLDSYTRLQNVRLDILGTFRILHLVIIETQKYCMPNQALVYKLILCKQVIFLYPEMLNLLNQ